MKDYLVDAIFSLRPGCEFVMQDNDYSTIDWVVLKGSAPTQAEIDSEIENIKAQEIADKTAAETSKAAAEAKLAALGLTKDDLKALGL
jgi:hypothetical protein